MVKLTKADVLFPVAMCPMKTTETIDSTDVRIVPKFRAVRRLDTGEVLGVVGSSYKIVPNKDCITGLEAALTTLQIAFDIDVYTAVDNAELYMRYNLPLVNQSLSTNEKICVSIVLVNSYNGWTRVGIEMEIQNLNTGTYYNFGHKLIRVNQLHVKSANMGEVMSIVSKLIDHFNNDVFPKFDAMTQKVIDKAAGDAIIEGVKEIPDKYQLAIKGKWALSNGTLWKLFSAFSDVTTSQIDSVKRQRLMNGIAWGVVSNLL